MSKIGIKKIVIKKDKEDSPAPIEKKTIKIKTSNPSPSPQEQVPRKEKKLVEIHNDEGEDLKRLELRDFIYLVPDTYVGSDQQTEREAPLMDLDKFIPIDSVITFPQAFERIFLEGISNAGDNALRSMNDKVDPGIIEVTMDSHWVKIRNGGNSFKVKIHQKEKLWTPYMAFGVPHVSSNYDTTKKRKGCGRNGIGIKATSIFSKNFNIDIGDTWSKQRYQQDWKENMKEFSEPIITPYNGPAYVEISYLADFERFGYDAKVGYPEEAFGLFSRYVYDYSQTIRSATSFNGHLFEPSKDPKDHARFYFGDVPMITHYEWPAEAEVTSKKNGYQEAKDRMDLPIAFLVVADTPGNGKCVSFVNGMMTLEGGVHVNEALKCVSKPLIDIINASRAVNKKGAKDSKITVDNKDEKKTKLSWKDVKNHISILLVCHLEDPQFGGQTKEKLVKPTPKFNIPDRTLAPVNKWSLVSHLMALADTKLGKLFTNSDGKKTAHIDILKGIDANQAGRARSADCRLFVVEGKSASNYAIIAQGIIPDGPEYVGILPLRGKPINVMKADPFLVAKNAEIKELKKFLGLEEFIDYKDPKNFKRLRYGGLVILSDADDDGTHIRSLILLIFHVFFPSLLDVGFVEFLRTPIIRIKGTKYGFYTDAEYQIFIRNNPNHGKLGKPKYYKGLGSSNKDDIIVDFRNPMYVKCIYDDDEEKSLVVTNGIPFTAREALDMTFNQNRIADRKTWLTNWKFKLEDLNVGRLEQINISEFINKEVAIYAFRSLVRAIPSQMDGLKDVERKIVWMAWLTFGKSKSKKDSLKVSAFAGSIVTSLEYHHAPASLEKAIIGMAQHFVGSNNLPLLQDDGLFGSREEGGKDASAPRYISAEMSKILPYLMHPDDTDLVECRFEDGSFIEPKFLLFILPLAIINGAHGAGMGWSTHVVNHNPADISNWYKARLKGNELPKIIPWFRGFKGQVTVENRKDKKPTKLKKIIIKGKKAHKVEEEIPEEEKEIDEEEIQSDKEEETPDEEFIFTEKEEPLKKEQGLTLVTRGCFEVKGNVLEVTELPIGIWTVQYRERLGKWLAEKKISDFTWHGDEENVHFKIYGFQNPTYDTLKLKKSYGMTNMTFIDENDRPIKFKNVEDLLESFYQKRLPYFEARKKKVLSKYELEINRLDAKMRYIMAYWEGKINLKADEKTINEKLKELNLPDFVRDTKTRGLAKENVEKLKGKIDNITKIRDDFILKTPESIWYENLVEFDQALENLYRPVKKTVKITKKK